MNVRAGTERAAVRPLGAASPRDGSVTATMTAATIPTKTANTAVSNALSIIKRSATISRGFLASVFNEKKFRAAVTDAALSANKH